MKIGKVTLNGNHQKIAKELQKFHKEILTGTMLSIDPGSTSPGWALWKLGRLVDSGVIKTKSTHKIAERLAVIHDYLESLPQADVVLIEKIGQSRGNGKIQSHRYLLWSIGAIAGALRCKNTIEIPQTLWFKFRDKDWTKGDEEDSIAIGRTAIAITRDGRKDIG